MLHDASENEILMHLRKSSRQKEEVSLDEPLNVDWDGNELLLSDIFGNGRGQRPSGTGKTRRNAALSVGVSTPGQPGKAYYAAAVLGWMAGRSKLRRKLQTGLEFPNPISPDWKRGLLNVCAASWRKNSKCRNIKNFEKAFCKVGRLWYNNRTDFPQKSCESRGDSGQNPTMPAFCGKGRQFGFYREVKML